MPEKKDDTMFQAEAPAEVAAPKAPTFKPIEPEDAKANPVFIELPKSDAEVAEEGTALADAGSEETGGSVPFLSVKEPTNKRIWSLDADLNTNLRGIDGNKPDLVERDGA